MRLAATACLALAGSLFAPLAAQAQSISCPHDQIRREIVTPIEDPWWFTPIIWGLTDTRVSDIGDEPALICEYGSAGTIQRRPPEGQTCVAVDGGFNCSIDALGPPPDTCFNEVQGNIAWNYEGATTWAPGNINRLCAGAERVRDPAQCFWRVMHGGLDWGGGTQWEWENAVDLCEGTTDANATIACFQAERAAGRPWPAAIANCGR